MELNTEHHKEHDDIHHTSLLNTVYISSGDEHQAKLLCRGLEVHTVL